MKEAYYLISPEGSHIESRRQGLQDLAAERDARMNTTAPQDIYDTVIVGAGTAGCVLANRLSADPSRRVLLLEAGGADDYHWVHIPVGYLYCIGNPRTDWCFRTEPSEPGLNGRSLIYPRGKVLGGCSGDQRHDLHARPGARLRPLAAVSAMPAGAGTTCCPTSSSARGPPAGPRGRRPGNGCTATAANGASRSMRLRWRGARCSSARRRRAGGIPQGRGLQSRRQRGLGYFEVNQRSGVRWNAAKAFLRPGDARRTSRCWTKAQVAAACSSAATTGVRCSGAASCATGDASSCARAAR
jgi:choline dehydrogenase